MPNNSFTSEFKFLARNVADAYSAHQAAWDVVGPSSTDKRHFHHDYNLLPNNHGCLITVRAEPHYFDKAHYFHNNASVIRTRFDTGTMLRFSLTAVASIKSPNKPERQCFTYHEHENWIVKNSVNRGFSVDTKSLEIDNEPAVVAKPGRPIFFLNRAYFEGLLTVTDSDGFADSLISGLGRHKGLGFGMLKIINDKGN